MPLQRYYSHYKHRTVSYYNPVSNGLWSETSGYHGDLNNLQQALTACDTSNLYILPATTDSYPRRVDFTDIPGCEVKKFLSKRQSGTIFYNGRYINFYPVNIWFDVKSGDRLGSEVKKGMEILKQVLTQSFQPPNKSEVFSVELLATPGQLGGDLLKRSLPFNYEYEPLPDSVAQMLLENTIQGRIETFGHKGEILNDLHDYDGRWFYAACYRHIPTGACIHDTVPELALTPLTMKKDGTPAKRAFIPGFYKAVVTIPDTWSHIGLLPMRTGDTSTYPRVAGYSFETFASSPEIQLAHSQGWKIEVKERVLWPLTDKQPEPLKNCFDHLVKIRMEIADRYPEPYRGMLRSAARNILLHTVGSFHRTIKELDGYTSDPDSIPEESTSELMLEGGIWKFTLPAKLSPLQLMLCQPHWSMYLWGTARAKLAYNALQVPFNQLVALRVDAIWTEGPVNFEDTGKVGQFVNKPLKQRSGLQWPSDTRAMVQLVQAVKE